VEDRRNIYIYTHAEKQRDISICTGEGTYICINIYTYMYMTTVTAAVEAEGWRDVCKDMRRSGGIYLYVQEKGHIYV